MYQDGRGVSADLAVAVAAYEDGCKGGSSPACDNLGRSMTRGAAWAGEAGDAEGCFEVGWLYAEGRGARRSEQQAAALYAQACNGGYEAACAMAKAPPPRS